MSKDVEKVAEVCDEVFADLIYLAVKKELEESHSFILIAVDRKAGGKAAIRHTCGGHISEILENALKFLKK
jgi:hypothetical protein